MTTEDRPTVSAPATALADAPAKATPKKPSKVAIARPEKSTTQRPAPARKVTKGGKPAQTLAGPKPTPKPASKPKTFTFNGQTYASKAAFAESLGVAPSLVRRAIRKGKDLDGMVAALRVKREYHARQLAAIDAVLATAK